MTRVAALDTKSLQQRTERTLAKIESTLNDVAAKKLSDEAVALLAELRKSNAELQATLANPTFKKLPESADAAIQKVRDLVARSEARVVDRPHGEHAVAS